MHMAGPRAALSALPSAPVPARARALARAPAPAAAVATAAPSDTVESSAMVAAAAPKFQFDPSAAPVFTVDMYTNTTAATGQGIYSSKTTAPQDLIISIQVSNNEKTGYNIEEFDVSIPIGGADDGSGNNYLMKNYTGGGVTVLSNLRFNAVAVFEPNNKTGGQYLTIRILPRSSKGYTNVMFSPELSVMLAWVLPNLYPRRQTPVPVDVKLKYRGELVWRSQPIFYANLINTDFPRQG